jgi:hypothetical protein
VTGVMFMHHDRLAMMSKRIHTEKVACVLLRPRPGYSRCCVDIDTVSPVSLAR